MPSATAREFQRVANRRGFVKIRQTGSHERWIGPPLFHKILRQLGLLLEEFEQLR